MTDTIREAFRAAGFCAREQEAGPAFVRPLSDDKQIEIFSQANASKLPLGENETCYDTVYDFSMKAFVDIAMTDTPRDAIRRSGLMADAFGGAA